MQIILNYKSYYETFKLGVIDDGYKAVADVLFDPLFKDHKILDEEGNPYEVDPQNSSRWAKGTVPIQKEIREAAGKKEYLQKMIDHFKDIVVPSYLSDALRDEMLDAMVELVKECDLPERTKATFLKCYEKGNYGEFLARVFQRALLGKNKVATTKIKIAASEEKVAAVDEFNELVRGKYKKPHTVVPNTVQPEEMEYVGQLYKAYEITTGNTVSEPDDLDPLDYRFHFDSQRKLYYYAETIHRELRDSIRRNEEDSFDIFKEEIKAGIFRAYRAPYPNPVEKIDAVTERASNVILSPNTEKIMYNWIGPMEKMGVCHWLVNKKEMKWVESNGQ